MPRYYFHLLNDVDVPDQEGKELPDLEAARAQASFNIRFTAGEILKGAGSLSVTTSRLRTRTALCSTQCTLATC